MATFRDPFKGLANVNADNALNVRLENLRNIPEIDSGFIAGLEKLITVRNTFLIAKESGFLEQISFWPHFQMILQWLNGEIDTMPYQSAPKIQNYSEIDGEKSTIFLNNVTNLETNCLSTQQYQLAVTIIGAIIAQKRINTEPNFAALIENQEARLESQRLEFTESLKNQADETSKDISLKTTSSLKEIETEAESKLSSIQQANALEEWQGHYDELLGKVTVKDKARIVLEFEKNDSRWTRIGKFGLGVLPNTAMRLVNSLSYLFRRLLPVTPGYIGMADQYRLWKNVWLFMLFASEATLTFIFTQVWHWNYKDRLAEILAYKLSVAILLGVLYASANKNYRIYANLSDQVKHRSVVAKTIRGIILDQTISDTQKDYKAELVAIGARAMFELKTIGHLSKKESSSPLIETVREVIK